MHRRPFAAGRFVVRASEFGVASRCAVRQGNSVRKLRTVLSSTIWVRNGPLLTVCRAAPGKPRGTTVKCLLEGIGTVPERE